MKSPQFLARTRAAEYLEQPKSPEREWPWGLTVIMAIVVGLGAVIAVALEAKHP